jgi:ankyrin repeat protein
LHCASLAGKADVVELLLENGANVDSTDNQGFTALHLATKERHETVVRLLLSKRPRLTVRAEDKEGYLPIHFSCSQLSILKMLLDHGADIKSTTNTGKSLMHLAAILGNIEVVEFLKSKGMPIDLRDNENKTPFQLATVHGNELKELLSPETADRQQQNSIDDGTGNKNREISETQH